MFLCTPCHEVSDCELAPGAERTSMGNCEMCSTGAVCIDCHGYSADEMANATVATGGLFAVLYAGLEAMKRIHPVTGVEVLQLGAEPTEDDSTWEPIALEPNQMVVRFAYLNSPYVVTVERLR